MKNRINLAVLISGSYRNFDDIWPTNKVILDKLKVPYDIFFHTWVQNPNLEHNILNVTFQNRFYLSFFPKTYEKFPQNISESHIREKYEFSFIKVEKFHEKIVAVQFNLGDRESNRLYQQHLNSCGMYLGIDACAKAMFSGAKYSHFLRIRPDFKLDSETIHEVLNYDLVFFGQLLPTEEGLIGDQCYGGRLSKSGKILSTMNYLYRITNSPDWNLTAPQILAENVLRIALANNRKKLRILYLNGRGIIVRPSLRSNPKMFSFKFLLDVILHNIKVLCKKLNLTQFFKYWI